MAAGYWQLAASKKKGKIREAKSPRRPQRGRVRSSDEERHSMNGFVVKKVRRLVSRDLASSDLVSLNPKSQILSPSISSSLDRMSFTKAPSSLSPGMDGEAGFFGWVRL